MIESINSYSVIFTLDENIVKFKFRTRKRVPDLITEFSTGKEEKSRLILIIVNSLALYTINMIMGSVCIILLVNIE
jgi:hypothetical protein